MFNKILVPLDGSRLSEWALAPAFALGQQAEAEVLLLRVAAPESMLVPSPHYSGYDLIWPDQALERARIEAKEYLQALRASNLKLNLVLRTEVIEGDIGGDAAGAIVDSAVEENADLIVMSTHGYSGLQRWILGSVTEKVLRSASCPVLVIRSSKPLRRILIPLDGSELSERALRPGLDIAESLQSDVTLLRAGPKVDPSAVEYLEQIEIGLGRRMEKEIQKDAETYLRNLIATWGQSGLEIKTAVAEEPAANSILEYAETHSIDLIIMSTHGRTGLRRWVYGSVAEKVMRGGCCSMLVIRPPGHALI